MNLEELLRAAGIEEQEVQAAAAEGPARLQTMIASRLALPGPRRYTAGEVSELAGVAREEADRLWLAMGFPLVSDDDRVFTDADVEALITARDLFTRAGIDAALALQLTRTMSRAVALIASALQDVMAPLTLSDDPAHTVRRAVSLVEESLPALDRLLVYLFRRHLSAAAERTVLAAIESPEQSMTFVGFADLVGFTGLSQELDEQDLAQLIERFSGDAMDLVADAGGRVVKMIGDEIMFDADQAGVGAEIGLRLTEEIAVVPDRPSLRVGLAGGRVLALQGDLFGPPVNLASRLVDFARPGTVVVDRVIRDLLERDDRFVFTAIRPHKLKGFGTVATYAVRRRPDR
jgi:adenylate cyclase